MPTILGEELQTQISSSSMTIANSLLPWIVMLKHLITSSRRYCFRPCRFVCLFIYLFVCLSICLFVCLSAGYLKKLQTEWDETWWVGWVCDREKLGIFSCRCTWLWAICQHIRTVVLHWISMKLGGWIGHVTRTNWIDFGKNPRPSEQVTPVCILGMTDSKISQKVTDGFGWNLACGLGMWQGWIN